MRILRNEGARYGINSAHIFQRKGFLRERQRMRQDISNASSFKRLDLRIEFKTMGMRRISRFRKQIDSARMIFV